MPYPSTVATTAVLNLSQPTLGQRLVDYTQNGVWWIAARHASNDEVRFYYSTNVGNTWNYVSAMDLNAAGQSGDYGTAMFIDKDDYMHLLISGTDGANNVTHYYRGVPDIGRTLYTFTHTGSYDEVSNGTAGFGNFHDIVAFRDNTSGWHVWFTTDYWDTSYWYPRLNHITLNSLGVPTAMGNHFPDTGLNGNTGQWVTSLDFRHTAADPKAVQSSTPSLYLLMVQNSDDWYPFYAKWTYSAGSWSAGSAFALETSDTWRGYAVGLVYDGTRVMMSGVRSSTSDEMVCFERDEADTTTTNRVPGTPASDGEIRAGGIGCDLNGNVFMVQAGATSQDIKKNRFNRGTTTWGGWLTLATGTISYEGLVLSRYLQPGTTGILPVLYEENNSNTALFMPLWTANEAEATLQGVGSASATGAVGVKGESSLQGVGSIAPVAALGFNPPALLQGVGTVSPDSTLTPFRDFTVYDGYMDGDGLNQAVGLIYFEGEGFRNTEESQPLRPPRSDIGNEPTELRPESGEIFSQQDFSNGAGQLYYHHEGRDVRRYLWSEGFDVDIDTVGRPATLVHLHDVPAAAYASTNVGDIVIFNDLPFVTDGTTFRRGDGALPGAWTAEDPHASETATTIQDATSSGEYLYAALGVNGIHRRDTSGAWSHWSAVQATRISWVKSRIIASDGQSIYEVISAGAAPTPIETLPVGWSFQDIFEVSGFIYALASNSTAALTRVHAYGLNEGGTAVEKKSETPFPSDQLLVSGIGYLDTCFIGGGIRTPDGGYDPVVYQALVVDRDRGALSYSKITEGEGAGAIDLSVLAFEPVGENVICGWSLGSGFAFGPRDGLALYKLKNGAFFPFLKTSGAGTGKQIRSIASYKGRTLFTTRGGGLYYEDPSRYVLDAYLVSSVADWNTTAEKVWDTVQLSHNPLPAGTSVSVDYTTQLPTTGQWVPALTNNVTAEELDASRFTQLSSRLLAVRIRSTASSSQLLAPSGHGFLIRSNILPDDAEWRLTRYIRILKRDRKDSHGEDVYIADTHTRKRDIQLTAYNWVTLYEPGVVWTCRVAKIANVTPLVPQFEETTGEERSEAYVMQLTLEGVRD